MRQVRVTGCLKATELARRDGPNQGRDTPEYLPSVAVSFEGRSTQASGPWPRKGNNTWTVIN